LKRIRVIVAKQLQAAATREVAWIETCAWPQRPCQIVVATCEGGRESGKAGARQARKQMARMIEGARTVARIKHETGIFIA
jgi:hypothetical protein